MRPVMAAESSRLYEIVILGTCQPDRVYVLSVTLVIIINLYFRSILP